MSQHIKHNNINNNNKSDSRNHDITDLALIVFRNKYLLMLIGNSIHSITYILVGQSDTYTKSLTSNTRNKQHIPTIEQYIYKYRDIPSLEWIIKYQYHSLLEYYINEKGVSKTLVTPSIVKYIVLHCSYKLMSKLYHHNSQLFERCCYLLDTAALSKVDSLQKVALFHDQSLESCYTLVTKDALHNASCNGSMEVVQYLHLKRREGCHSHTVDVVAALGHLEVLDYLLINRKDRCSSRAMDDAALNGRLHVVKYLHRIGMKCTQLAMNGASKNGHLSVVQYLADNRTEGCTTDAIDLAAENGHVNICRYLLSTRREGFNERILELVSNKCNSTNNNIELLELLLNNRQLMVATNTSKQHAVIHFNVYDRALENACKRGYLPLVKLLIERDLSKQLHLIINAAAESGNVDCVKYLHYHPKTRLECNQYALNIATKKSHLEVVKFLVENRNEGIIEQALQNAERYSSTETYLLNVQIRGSSSNQINNQYMNNLHEMGLVDEFIMVNDS